MTLYVLTHFEEDLERLGLYEAELRSQALIRAAEERKTRLATLEEQIKSYETPT